MWRARKKEAMTLGELGIGQVALTLIEKKIKNKKKLAGTAGDFMNTVVCP